MGMKARLPFGTKTKWRWRWMQTGNSEKLHRIKSYGTGGSHPACDKLDWGIRGVGEAETVCGLTGEFVMPGLMSRMGAMRCRECCVGVGIAVGRGAPFNDGLNV